MIPLLSTTLFATLAAIATCAPAIPLVFPTNSTLTTYQCTDSQKWAAPDFRRRECYMTIKSKAFLDELDDFGDESVEFYTNAGGLPPLQRKFNLQPVPRKYTSGMSVTQKPHSPLHQLQTY